ncbi:MAG TPA: hypothetical protein PLY93_10870 [Turneriella sp.]|nr:hypothetical protein [Turneriella sp.]
MALWVGFHSFNLKENPAVLTSFGFQLMLYFGLFTVFSVRERRRFWSSRPSRVMLLAGFFEAALGALVSIVGLPYFAAIPWTLTFFSISSTATVVFIFNDWVKARLYR